MNSRGIQTVLCLGQAQEARTLFIGFGSKTLYLFQLRAGGEGAFLLTPGHDILGRSGGDTRHPAQQRRAGRIQVYAHTVDTVLHNTVQRFVQALLGHIVLILTYTHSLGVDLDQFRQGVLQTAGNGNRTAQVYIELRELLGGQLAGGIYRSACLTDYHILQMQPLLLGQLPNHSSGKLLGFVPGSTVADGHYFHAVFAHHFLYNTLGLIYPFELRHRINHVGIQHFAGGVHHRHFAAHAVAGVQAHDRFAPDRRLKQQLTQIVAKDFDGTFRSRSRQFPAQFVFQAGMNQPAVGIQSSGFHQQRTGTAGLFAGKHPGRNGSGPLTVHLNGNFQIAFPLAAVQRQHTMPRNFGKRLGIVVILGIDTVLILGLGAGDPPKGPVIPAQFGTASRIVGHCLGQNILGAGQCRGHIGHFFIQILRSGSLGIKGRILFQDGVGQRLQTTGFGNAGPGLALGFIGAVDILHLSQSLGFFQRGGQFRSHGSLLGNGGSHFLLALIQPAQVFQPVAQVTEHLVIHGTSGFLTVAGNERDGVSLVDQINGSLHIFDTQVQFGSQLFSMILHSVSSFSYDTITTDTPHRQPPRPG